MNALDFVANVKVSCGGEYYGEEVYARLPRDSEEVTYFFMDKKKDSHHYYEYITLTPKYEGEYQDFLTELILMLYELPAKEQIQILGKMKKIEVVSDVPLKGSVDMSCNEYPLFSVRGTCGMENQCKMNEACSEVYGNECCCKRTVGFSNIASMRHPTYDKIFADLVLWLVRCPNLDAVLVMHGYPPYFCNFDELMYENAFVIKDNKIRYIDDSAEAEKIYKEYHKKYPCDTHEVERIVNDRAEEPINFHF